MSLEIANTIKNQIGQKSLTMIGAKNLVADKNSLAFRIGRNPKKVNYIKIKLNDMDTYNMTFGKIGKFDYEILNEVTDVYSDQLNKMIEHYTGMYTSL